MLHMSYHCATHDSTLEHPQLHAWWRSDRGTRGKLVRCDEPLSLWRRTCSPGDPTPQRQCAWLLSTYPEESEEQKEVLEAKDDEEKEDE